MSEEKSIILFGKVLFGLSFLLGNVALFGYIITKNNDFAFMGFGVLCIGTIVNLIVFISLLIYGFIRKHLLDACFEAAMILLINIPIGLIYAYVGIELTGM